MANIPINAARWQALSAADQQKVNKILTGAGLLRGGDAIVEDPDSPADGPLWDPIGDIGKALCQAACTAAEGVAVAACAGLAGPAAAVCVAAAHAAANACRNSC